MREEGSKNPAPEQPRKRELLRWWDGTNVPSLLAGMENQLSVTKRRRLLVQHSLLQSCFYLPVLARYTHPYTQERRQRIREREEREEEEDEEEEETEDDHVPY